MLKKNPSKTDQVIYYNSLYKNKETSMSPWNKKIAQYLKTRKNKKSAKVINIGCGKGTFLYYFIFL